MTWRCALIQRWLPAYPDAEASSWRRRLVAGHLEHCPDCRRELTEIEETIRAVQAAPVPDPGEEFWADFNRELHLKLVQVNQERRPAGRRRLLPYVLAGAPALAVLLLWLGGHINTISVPLPAKLAERVPETAPEGGPPSRLTRGSTATAPGEASVELAAHPRAGANHLPGPEKVLYAGIDEGLWEEDMDLNWEVDPVLADLSQQEREALAKKLTGREP